MIGSSPCHGHTCTATTSSMLHCENKSSWLGEGNYNMTTFERLVFKLQPHAIKDRHNIAYYTDDGHGEVPPTWTLRLKPSEDKVVNQGTAALPLYFEPHSATLVPRDKSIGRVTHDFVHKIPVHRRFAPRILVDLRLDPHPGGTYASIEGLALVWTTDHDFCKINDYCAVCLSLKPTDDEPDWHWLRLPCGHNFHAHCLYHYKRSECPMCKAVYNSSADVSRCLKFEYSQAILQAELQQQQYQASHAAPSGSSSSRAAPSSSRVGGRSRGTKTR